MTPNYPPKKFTRNVNDLIRMVTIFLFTLEEINGKMSKKLCDTKRSRMSNNSNYSTVNNGMHS